MPPRITIKVPSQLVRSKLTGKVMRAANRAVQNATPRLRAALGSIVSEEADRGQGSERYTRELQKPDAIKVSSTDVTIVIQDPLLRAIEQGADGFDIKTKMLARARSSKRGGYYVDIPFLHDATTGKAALGSAATPGRSFTKTVRARTGNRRVRVQHSRGITDNMRRRGNSYVTIRRISSRSPASSWMHPGFRGRRVLKKIRERVRIATINILKTALADVGFKVE